MIGTASLARVIRCSYISGKYRNIEIYDPLLMYVFLYAPQSESAHTPRPWCVLVNAADNARTPVHAPVFKIGRSIPLAGAGLQVAREERSVSRLHCVLLRDRPGGVRHVLVDLSHIGTFLDGERVPLSNDPLPDAVAAAAAAAVGSKARDVTRGDGGGVGDGLRWAFLQGNPEIKLGNGPSSPTFTVILGAAGHEPAPP